MALGTITLGQQVTVGKADTVWTISAIRSIPDPTSRHGHLILGYEVDLFLLASDGSVIRTTAPSDYLALAATSHEHDTDLRSDEGYACSQCGTVLTGERAGVVASTW